MASKTPAPAPAPSAQVPDFWRGPAAFRPFYDDMQRTFEGFLAGWPGALHAAPPIVKVDYAETPEGVELTAELPGLTEKDVSVTLVGDALTVSGEKHAESERKDDGYTLSERSYGAFSRSIRLPSDIDASKMEATFANGLLKVTAPRKAQAKPHKVEVKASPSS